MELGLKSKDKRGTCVNTAQGLHIVTMWGWIVDGRRLGAKQKEADRTAKKNYEAGGGRSDPIRENKLEKRSRKQPKSIFYFLVTPDTKCGEPQECQKGIQ